MISLADIEKTHNLYLRKVDHMLKHKKAARGHDKNPIFTPEGMLYKCTLSHFCRSGETFHGGYSCLVQDHV